MVFTLNFFLVNIFIALISFCNTAQSALYIKGFRNYVNKNNGDLKQQNNTVRSIADIKSAISQKIDGSGFGFAIGMQIGGFAIEIERGINQLKFAELKQNTANTIQVARKITEQVVNKAQDFVNQTGKNNVAYTDQIAKQNNPDTTEEQKSNKSKNEEDFKYSATMANIYYNSYFLGDLLHAYGSLGLGYTNQKSLQSKKDQVLQAKFGLGIGISRVFIPYLGYKITSFKDLKKDAQHEKSGEQYNDKDKKSQSLTLQQLEVGLAIHL